MVKNSKKIPIKIISESTKIFILKRKKYKLSELYPQRAIIEEHRKSSSLIQATDWIDHDYYEKELEKSKEREKNILKKYGAKIPDQSIPPLKPVKTYRIQDGREKRD